MCLIGLTGLKPGAIENVRSPSRLRIDLNWAGLKTRPQNISISLSKDDSDADPPRSLNGKKENEVI